MGGLCCGTFGTGGGWGTSHEQSTSPDREIGSQGEVKRCGAYRDREGKERGNPWDMPLIRFWQLHANIHVGRLEISTSLFIFYKTTSLE